MAKRIGGESYYTAEDLQARWGRSPRTVKRTTRRADFVALVPKLRDPLDQRRWLYPRRGVRAFEKAVGMAVAA